MKIHDCTRFDKVLSKKIYFFVQKSGADGEIMARESVIDWSKYNLATEAFKKCDEDGNEGLSWDEVEACEVRFLVQFFMKISVVSILICQLVFQLIEIFES